MSCFLLYCSEIFPYGIYEVTRRAGANIETARRACRKLCHIAFGLGVFTYIHAIARRKVPYCGRGPT
jgi:hypothetical protein